MQLDQQNMGIFSQEMLRVNDHMDADYITIQRYKNKLEKCQQNLSIYEPF